MRFAPPPSLRMSAQASGLNSMSVRSTNERLILSLLVQHGALSRLELGRHSGLSAQTVSVIVRALQRDGLIVAGEAQRGRVGPPTVPVALSREGALGVGVSLQAHGVDAVLTGLTGEAIHRLHAPVDPHADPVGAMDRTLDDLLDRLSAEQAQRLAGIGVALPGDPGSWAAALEDGTRLEARLAGATGRPVYIQNGVTAAAGAESVFGAARALTDYLFVHLGAVTEYRLVLQHRVYAGDPDRARPTKAGDLADLAGCAAEAGRLDWQDEAAVGAWIEVAAPTIAAQVRALASFVQLRDIILAGLPPARVRARLVAALARDLPGTTICAGTVPDDGTAVGAATLALTARYLLQE